ncbi:MAG: extracellular solute-binding protein [Hyphomicrobiaceae bacterium]|nr:extracellular solute-binding protein [Hyphomicrobiaceae bacterium]
MKPLSRRLLFLSTAIVTSLFAGVALQAQDKVPVSVLMIGYPDQDSTDAVTGVVSPGIGHLEEAFEAANPGIDLQIINIPWGEGATGYAPKTEAMIQGNEACLYEMPGAAAFARRGALVDLSKLIEADSSFVNLWGPALTTLRIWGPDNPQGLYFIPNNTGERVIHWDATLFDHYGVEPLSKNPTLDEIAEKAKLLTGTDPVTGEQTYGYYYQGKYAVWQFLSIAHAMGANWGSVGADGKMTIEWNTPTYLKALEWFVDMAKYAPEGALASDGMPQGFLSDDNVVAIIPEGEQGYFIQPLIANPDLQARYRSSFNLRGPDGVGGVSTISPLAMAASCENKDAAWTALKWLAGSADAERYYFESNGRIPTSSAGAEALPQIASFPDGDVVLTQPQFAEAPYPWAAAQPRWAMQTALEGALAGTLTPAQALEQAQAETDAWLAEQQ